MRKACGAAALVAAALSLAGCGLPPALTIASYGADAVSYVTTGKSVTDRIYSKFARSDCAMMRVFSGRPICIDEKAKARDVRTADAASAPAKTAPGRIVEADAAPRRDTYVMIGSFLDAANAQRSIARYAAFHPVIVPVLVRGLHFNRVVAGPLSATEADILRGEIAAGSGAAKHAA